MAVGGVLRRLFSKCLLAKVAQKAEAFPLPHQFGLGVKGGCKAVVHTTRVTLSDTYPQGGEVDAPGGLRQQVQRW